MVKTKIERVEVARPDVAAFRVEGKLGFHENAMVQRLVEECLKRSLTAVAFDFSDLSSLGGGVAKILREFAETMAGRGGRVAFIVTNDIITQFLQQGEKPVSIYRSLVEAVTALAAQAPAGARGPSPASEAPGEAAPAAATGQAPAAAPVEGSPDPASPGVILMAYDDAGPGAAPAAPEPAAAGAPAAPQAAPDPAPRTAPAADLPPASPEPARAPAASGASSDVRAQSPAPGSDPLDGEAEDILSEIFRGRNAVGPVTIGGIPVPGNGAPGTRDGAAVVELNRQLKRRILELKTLFSISADFNSIWDRKKLLDIFLLTTIAQGGVESATFLEAQGELFKPVMSKGFEAEALARLTLSAKGFGKPSGENNVIPLETFGMDDETKARVRAEGIEYVCPFRTKDGYSGLVLLGKRIAGRGMKQEDFEFLRILVNIAQGAYDNALMFEREHDRTLGIVKTLISIIEENTLLKGTSEFVSRYVGMVAKNMDYSEDLFKDLIYGTVLRDMGMVKVSDLILRSPRDLTKEEWEIIKRHPEDGGEMLARMKFSEHVVSIVKTHHERFNGEGYPYGLRGKEIPLGSRIISVVESYAAMIHERPTRPALSEREALDTLRENYGLRYDREVVQHFTRVMEKEIARSAGLGAGVPSYAGGTS